MSANDPTDWMFSDRAIAEEMTAAYLRNGASSYELLAFANELMARAETDRVWTESVSGPIDARSDRSRYDEYMLTGRYEVPQSVVDACHPTGPASDECGRSESGARPASGHPLRVRPAPLGSLHQQNEQAHQLAIMTAFFRRDGLPMYVAPRASFDECRCGLDECVCVVDAPANDAIGSSRG